MKALRISDLSLNISRWVRSGDEEVWQSLNNPVLITRSKNEISRPLELRLKEKCLKRKKHVASGLI